jgi:hypothetical protein
MADGCLRLWVRGAVLGKIKTMVDHRTAGIPGRGGSAGLAPFAPSQARSLIAVRLKGTVDEEAQHHVIRDILSPIWHGKFGVPVEIGRAGC